MFLRNIHITILMENLYFCILVRFKVILSYTLKSATNQTKCVVINGHIYNTAVT